MCLKSYQVIVTVHRMTTNDTMDEDTVKRISQIPVVAAIFGILIILIVIRCICNACVKIPFALKVRPFA